jgi:DNA-binding SARP family transcriptional activator
VQLLVLSDGHRLLRDQAIDSLWPHLGAHAAAANLRKAAHYARHALGSEDAVVLRRGWVDLLPSHQVETDVEAFQRAATSALAAGDPAACAAAASAYGGDLLPLAGWPPRVASRRGWLGTGSTGAVRTRRSAGS